MSFVLALVWNCHGLGALTASTMNIPDMRMFMVVYVWRGMPFVQAGHVTMPGYCRCSSRNRSVRLTRRGRYRDTMESSTS